MSRWKKSYTTMSATEIFKTYFLFAAFFNIFGAIGCFYTKFYDNELTIRKWLGALVGIISNSAALILTYTFSTELEILPLAIVVLCGYYAFLVFFWIFSFYVDLDKIKNKKNSNDNIKHINREFLLKSSISVIRDLYINFSLGNLFANTQDNIISDIQEYFKKEEAINPSLFFPGNSSEREQVLKKTISIGIYHLLSFEKDFESYSKNEIWKKINIIVEEENQKENSVFGYESIVPIRNYFIKRTKELLR